MALGKMYLIYLLGFLMTGLSFHKSLVSSTDVEIEMGSMTGATSDRTTGSTSADVVIEIGSMTGARSDRTAGARSDRSAMVKNDRKKHVAVSRKDVLNELQEKHREGEIWRLECSRILAWFRLILELYVCLYGFGNLLEFLDPVPIPQWAGKMLISSFFSMLAMRYFSLLNGGKILGEEISHARGTLAQVNA